jgi:hypothetical protein
VNHHSITDCILQNAQTAAKLNISILQERYFQLPKPNYKSARGKKERKTSNLLPIYATCCGSSLHTEREERFWYKSDSFIPLSQGETLRERFCLGASLSLWEKVARFS